MCKCVLRTKISSSENHIQTIKCVIRTKLHLKHNVGKIKLLCFWEWNNLVGMIFSAVLSNTDLISISLCFQLNYFCSLCWLSRIKFAVYVTYFYISCALLPEQMVNEVLKNKRSIEGKHSHLFVTPDPWQVNPTLIFVFFCVCLWQSFVCLVGRRVQPSTRCLKEACAQHAR